jgi:NAD(P)-dependent dehydrogenase (short-subunit alcohol dehydrogenase family)
MARLTSSELEEIEDLSKLIYDYAFNLCDSLVSFTGNDAGRVAAAAAAAARREMELVYAIDCRDEQAEADELEQLLAIDEQAQRALEQQLADEPRRAVLLSMNQEDLDELVHDAKASEAADINNGGPESQVEYLLGKGGAL